MNLSRFAPGYLPLDGLGDGDAASVGTPVYDGLVAEFRLALRAIPGDRVAEELLLTAGGFDAPAQLVARALPLPLPLPRLSRHRGVPDVAYSVL